MSEVDYGIPEIQYWIPHRHPFLFVDRILELVPNDRIVGVKNVTMTEPFFKGHFPEYPVMPGVLIVEAMAQTAAVLLLTGIADRDKKLVFFSGIDGARFRRPVVPGDTLRLELKILKKRDTICRMKGEARVEGDLAAEATIMANLVDRPEPRTPAETQ